MAKNEVKLIFRVTDDGTLKLVTDKAKKAKKATDDLTSSTDNLTNSRNRYNKAEKGVGALGANSTKNFSKMNQTMGGSSGLVAAYATLAANAFAATAAFSALRRAAAFEQLVGGLTEIGSAAGQNLPYVSDQLRDITDNAISAEQALRATAVATSSGFDPTQLAKLTKVAKGASTALGRDMGDALDRLVRGTAKLEPEILDELGIIVRLDDATETYAASIGKTASQLTTFERQQAFLNATIDQGTKKFGEIAENVEVNAFDQLASTFQDLTKNVLELVNVGIVPLVKFLGQNQFALFGVLTLFVSSIGRTLVPSIQQVAAVNKAAAAQSALAYKKSGTVISAEFKKIQGSAAATANTTKVLPASVQKMIPAYKAGTLSVKELQVMVKRLSSSEKLREVAQKKRNAEDRAAKQIELDGIRALRLETEALIAAESRRVTVTSGGQRARGRSTGAGLTARGLSEMDNASGVMSKLGVAARYTSLQFMNVGKTFTRTATTIGQGAAFLNATRVAFTAAAGAVRLFGTALISAIPFIGQAFLIFSLFQEPIMGFINRMRGVDPELEKIKESFNSFADINTKLAKTLEHSESSFESFTASIAAKTGVVNQLESALQGLIDKEQERRNTEINSNIDSIIAKETELNALRNNMAKGLTATTGHAGRENKKKEKRLQEEIAALRAENVQLQKDPSKQTGDSDLGRRATEVARSFQDKLLTADTALAAAFTDQDRDRIQDIIDTLANGGTIEGAMESLEEYSGRYDRLNGAIKGLPDALSEVDAEQAKLVQKSQGPLGALIDRYDAVGNTINSIVKETKDAGGDIASALSGINRDPKLAKMGSKLGTVLGLDGIAALAERAGIDITKGLNASAPELLSARLKEINEQLMSVGDRSKEAAEKAKDIGQVARENAAATALQIRFEKESVQIKLDGLALEEESANLNLKGKELQDKLAEIEGKRVLLKEQMIKPEDAAFRITSARLANEKKLLSFTNRRLAALQSMLDLETRMTNQRLALERLTQGSTVTAEDQAKVLRAQQAEADKLEDQKLDAKLKGIDLEYDLLAAQFTLEEAKIDRLAKELNLTEGQVSALKDPVTAARGAIEGEDGLRATAKAAATAEAQAAKDSREIAAQTAEEKARREAITQEIERQVNATQILKNANREMAALRSEEATLGFQLMNLQNDLQIMRDKGVDENSLAFRQKELEIEKKKLEIIAKQREQRALDLDQAGRLGGSAGAALESANQSQQDSFGEGGAFNSDSGASAIEKVQAMRDMTSGMIAELAKLGPEGELAAAVAQAGMNMSETFLQLGENIKNAGSSMEKGASIAAAAGQAIGQIGAIMAAASQAKIAGIDQEIAAEKKRDGKSKESLAKIAKLEKKKEAAKRKAFEQNKKMQMAQTIANTASAVMQSFVNAGGFPLGLPMAVAMGAIGAAQLAVIAGTSYQGGGSAGGDVSGGPTAISMGERKKATDLARSQSARGELAYFRGEAGTGGPENFKNAFSGMKYRANGGNTAFMVGEQGPEMFIPDRPGTIVPNDEVAPVGNTNVSFNINTVDATGVEDLLVAQRGNIIGMIRDAANSYGQDFVEEVDTSVFNDTTGGVARY